MIQQTRDSTEPKLAPDSTGGTTAPTKIGSTSAASAPVAEIQESVDPFDYAETIVRDLAMHVGTRLKDFRADLAAMHSAVMQLPETMRINVLGQSIQELRERVAHLTGVVSHHATRPIEEIDRLGRQLGEVIQRLSVIEAWVASSRRAGSQGDGSGDGSSSPPLPVGGLVGTQQLDRLMDQVHESIVRVVGAVRELQLDLRDLRSDSRRRNGPDEAAARAVPEPAPAFADPWPELNRLVGRVGALEAPPVKAGGDLASLIFAAWPQLLRPAGADLLRQAVDSVLSRLEPTLDSLVRVPVQTKGSGLVAVGSARRSGRGTLVVLVATEDLCGHVWTLQADAAEMRTEEPPPGVTRVPCWRALLAAAALAESREPGCTVLPVLVYGNGMINRVPSGDEMRAYGARLGSVAAAGRLVAVAAQDVADMSGLGTVADVGTALSALNG